MSSMLPEEIEMKRKEALQRRNQMQQQKLSPFKSTASFYGSKSPNASNQNLHGNVNKTNLISEINRNSCNAYQNSSHNNKIQVKKAYQNSRVFSQPYSKSKPELCMKNNNTAAIFRKVITCVCSLVSETRFTINPSGYHDKLIETFKSIPSKSYDPETRVWTFHINDYDLVIERVNNLRPDVTTGTIPKSVFKILNEKPTNFSITCLDSLQPKLLDTLMPFQKQGVLFGIQKSGRCLIADEMGLGKTYQALAIADFYKNDFPLLICTTATTRNVWLQKVCLLLPYIPCQYVVCLQSTSDYFGEAKVLIVSYPLLEKNIEKIIQKKFGLLIMDESHILKNFKAKCTSAAIQLSKIAKRIILLTGTPALSRPAELFTQLQLLDPYFFSYKDYTIRYCEGKQTKFGWDATGQSNLSELNVLLNKKFMIRRTKNEVLTDLAEKSRETVVLDPTLIREGKDQLEANEKFKTIAEQFSQCNGKDRDDLLLKFYSATATYKAKAVCDYIKQLIKAENPKFLIFAHHTVMMNAISECLDKLKVGYIRIDGTTKNDIRTANVKHFQTDDNCRVAVLSLKACNSGITLTAAQLVLFAELDWNPSTLSQAESRAHRIGQSGIVLCRYLLAKNTVDDVIWNMLKEKQSTLKGVGLCNEDFSDATYTVQTTSENRIDNYFQTNKTDSNSLENEKECNHSSNPLADEPNEYQALLDEDDEDLANLIF